MNRRYCALPRAQEIFVEGELNPSLTSAYNVSC